MYIHINVYVTKCVWPKLQAALETMCNKPLQYSVRQKTHATPALTGGVNQAGNQEPF